jgi:cellulose synthase operon protein YhjQ
MGPDISRLLRVLRAPEFRYRDFHAAVSRPPRTRDRAPRPRLLIVAVSSLDRGVGRTTLAANLAAAAGRRGMRAAAVDLDPRDELRLHFRARSAPAAHDLDDLVRWGERSVGYVPFGRDPAAVIEALAARSGVVFLDTPAEASPALEQALAEADQVLVPVRAEAGAGEKVRAIEALLARWRRPAWRRTRARYVVNQFDARRRSDREALAVVRELVGRRLLSPPVQQDEAVRTAFAHGRCVQDEAPGSQVIADLEQIVADLLPARGRAAKDVS